MKRLSALSVIFVFFVLFFARGGYADLFELKEFKEHTFEVGPEIFYISYDQPDTMEEEGNMYGVYGAYTYHNFDPAFMLKVENRFTLGEVDFASASSGNMNGIDAYMYEIRGVGGYDFFLSNKSRITPYLGVGRRYFQDDSSGMITTTDKKGYGRESIYYYSPIGIGFIANMEDGWSIEGMAEYDKFWAGDERSDLSAVDSGFEDLEADQSDGYGFRAALKIQKRGKNIGFSIEPFIGYWRIEKSNESIITYPGVIIGLGYEPKNTTKEIGIRCTIIF